jgi:hypothetical protein
MKHDVHYDDGIGAIRMYFKGLFTQDDAGEFFPLTKRLCEGKEHCYLLCDFKEGGAEVPKDKEYRQWLSRMYTEAGFDKIAILNAHPAMRMLAKVVLAAVKSAKNVKFFKTEEEALTWFKGEKQ